MVIWNQQGTEDLTVRVNCSREEEGDGKQLVCLLLDPNPLDPIPNDSAKENRFAILLKGAGIQKVLVDCRIIVNCAFCRADLLSKGVLFFCSNFSSSAVGGFLLDGRWWLSWLFSPSGSTVFAGFPHYH